MLTPAEENYLKVIFHLSEEGKRPVSTNALAGALHTRPASVTDMVQRLSKKGLVSYHKYKGVAPSSRGQKLALQVIRKHRLWEVFLVQKLHFNWDEVHEVAEQLEHVVSARLVEQLDRFLGYPRYDPHGDPIPDASGRMAPTPTLTVASLQAGDRARVICARDSSSEFLLYLDKLNITLGADIQVLERFDYDGSYSISVGGAIPVTLSSKVAENIFIEKL